mgnify:CR=1 FL=1
MLDFIFMYKDHFSLLFSFSALAVSFFHVMWQIYLKSPRLKIFQDSTYPNYIFKYQNTTQSTSTKVLNYLSLKDDNLPSNSRILIYLRLENHSERAISISHAIFKESNTNKTTRTDSKISGVKYLLSYINGNPFTIDLRTQQLSLPLLIPPYEIKHGYLIFPFHKVTDISGKLMLYTTCGTKTIKVNVYTTETSFKLNPNLLYKITQIPDQQSHSD